MDGIANMLTAIRNAARVGKKQVSLPYSNFKHQIAKKLFEAGYLAGFSKSVVKNKPVLLLDLMYLTGDRSKVVDIRQISKQSRRVYYGVKQIKPVKNGQGELVLSTPKGVLLGSEAQNQQVGGEALFMIW